MLAITHAGNRKSGDTQLTSSYLIGHREDGRHAPIGSYCKQSGMCGADAASTASPLLVSTLSCECCAFWLLCPEEAVRPWAGLRRPRPGAGAVVVVAEGAALAA